MGPMFELRKSIHAWSFNYKWKSDYITQIASMILYIDKLLTDTEYYPR